MHNAIPLVLAGLIAVGIIVIGCFYLASPEQVLGSFGLKPPASDADTRAWLRPKGIRDVASGLVVRVPAGSSSQVLRNGLSEGGQMPWGFRAAL